MAVETPPADQNRTGAIHVGVEDGVATLAIDNPAALNAMTRAMWEALPDLIKRLEDRGDIRLMVLRGAGEKAFCTGADISEFDQNRVGTAVAAYDDINSAAFDAIAHAPFPTIAAIRGFCLGGGLQMALSCDLRFAAEDAVLGVPAARLGLGYNPRWIARLLATVRPPVAKDLLFTGRRVRAAEAFALGLLDRIAPVGRFDDDCAAFVQAIAANAPLTIRAAKRAIDHLASPLSTPDLAALDRLTAQCFDSADYAEGRAAFAARRKPIFQGQ